MALTAGQAESVRLYSGVESQPVKAYEGTSVTSTTWYKGDMVTTSSGLVTAVASNGAIAGIALDAPTAVDYTEFDLALIDPAAIYVVRVESGEESAREYIGEKHGFSFTAGVQRIDISEVATPDVYVVGIHPSDIGVASAGVDEGRVLVRFIYTTFIGV